MAKKISLIVFGSTPLFFLPFTTNYYDTNKWMLLTIGALLILLCWSIALFRIKKPLSIFFSWNIIGFLALTSASIIGVLCASTNKIEALVAPFGPLSFLALTIIILSFSAKKQDIDHLTWFLYTTISILGLIAIYQTLGMGKLMFPHTPFLQDSFWTPTGTVTSTIALFVITLSLLLPETIAAFKKHENPTMIAIFTLATLIISSGLIITTIQCIPFIANMLSFHDGWTIASQVFKQLQTAGVGFGVENFLTAFTLGRPASITVTYLTNANFFLHMLTVYGLVGLVAACIFIGTLFKTIKNRWTLITLLLCFISLLIIPPTLCLCTFISAIFVITHYSKTHMPKSIWLPAWIRISVGILVVSIAAFSFYVIARAYCAEVYFSQSLLATQANDGKKTYALQIQAMKENMYISRYHVVYSQTNLSLANSIASTKNISNDDRQIVAQLIQQAVREAKTAVALNPKSVAAWENLGFTYQSIMPVASDAATWATTAYENAAKFDPSNPTLFVTLGSVFTQQGQYTKAIAAFAQAIRLRPSYANAYYNLAHVYSLTGDTVQAAQALTKTLELVQPGSTDYYKAKNELDALQKTTP